MTDSRTGNSLRNIHTGLINRLVGIGMPFLMRTILIKQLGEQYLGLSSLFSSILQVLNLAELGFGSAIIYSMYKPIVDNDIETVCKLLNFYKKIYRLIGFIILLAGLIVMPYLNIFISGSYPSDINIYILYLIYLMNTVSSYLLFGYKRCLLEANQRSDILNNVSTIIQLIFNIIKIILLIILPNYYIYVIIIPIITIVDNIIVALIVNKKYPQYMCKGNLSKDKVKDIKKKVVGLLIQRLGYTISISLDSIVISGFLGLSTLASYSNYQLIESSVLNIVVMCYGALTASIGHSIAKENITKNYDILKKLVFFNGWIGCICSVCLICLYQPFMEIWVGSKLMLGIDTVILLTMYFYITQTRKLISVYKDAAGIWWEDKFRPLIGCTVNFVLNIYLVTKIGINGVIISTLISYIFIEIPWEIKVLFKEYFKISPIGYLIQILKFTIITIIISVCTYLICISIPNDGVIWFIVKGIVCIIVSNLLFLIIFYKNSEFNNVTKLIRNLNLFKN